jgi:hypothetical protein
MIPTVDDGDFFQLLGSMHFLIDLIRTISFWFERHPYGDSSEESESIAFE